VLSGLSLRVVYTVKKQQRRER